LPGKYALDPSDELKPVPGDKRAARYNQAAGQSSGSSIAQARAGNIQFSPDPVDSQSLDDELEDDEVVGETGQTSTDIQTPSNDRGYAQTRARTREERIGITR
jgi:hypothetical protein